ncbi:dienelactone hydrolase family protein [Chryseobacterium sp.]|uniref:dienelactone hydrolase family protein n=1 Tax=Chryseobacterium sp. TaxID=1871047 RepID=UPI00388DB9C3
MKELITLSAIALFSGSLKSQKLYEVTYYDGAQKLNGLITSTDKRPLPGVLILPAWKGIDNEAKTTALQLKNEGYIALIADIYGEGNVPTDNASAAESAGFYKQNYAAYQKRIKLALEELKKKGAIANKIAVIGFCFGGTGALEASRVNMDVAGVVSIHGGLAKDQSRANEAISAKVLVEHPADDESVSPEDYQNLVKELNEGKADWQIITYAQSKHTFTNPESPDYNSTMAKRAWHHTLLFLKEILK